MFMSKSGKTVFLGIYKMNTLYLHKSTIYLMFKNKIMYIPRRPDIVSQDDVDVTISNR